MSLKKRMFRSGMMILCSAVLAMILICGMIALLFEDTLERDFGSVAKAKLDSHVQQVTELIHTEKDYKALSKKIEKYGYELIVVKDNHIIYKNGGENLKEIWNDLRKEKQTEKADGTYYRHKTTITKTYDKDKKTTVIAARFTDSYSFLYRMAMAYPSLFWIGSLIVFLAVIVLFVLSYIFSKRLNQRIMKPLIALEEGAKRIQQGNLEEEIIYKGDSEFENVCWAFNDMQETILYDQKQREKNEQARQDMVTGISHDLRTPLTNIQGYIKGVLDGIADTQEKQEIYLKTAYEATKDMNILLQKLFEFSKIESGQTTFHMVPLDLSEYTQAYVAQKEIEHENIKFLYEKEQEILPDTLIDVDQMKRVFDNLLENSIKYSDKEQVEITIRAGIIRDEVYISWKDNGPGVREEKLPKIFDRFYRCDEARNKKGSGVGLYVVKYIIEQQMGSIQAENDNGLKITCHFPTIKK